MTTTTLTLAGRLDTARVADIETAFSAKVGAINKAGDTAVIDLSEVSYLSSMGIRLLVGMLKQFQQRGIRFATIRPRAELVNDTLAVAGLDGLLRVTDDAAAAAAMLAAAE